eukprot:15344573-Ditylum_brightwellii.AAC.2
MGAVAVTWLTEGGTREYKGAGGGTTVVVALVAAAEDGAFADAVPPHTTLLVALGWGGGANGAGSGVIAVGGTLDGAAETA